MPSTVRAVELDTLDGFWADTFDSNSTITFINGSSKCVLVDDTIVLTQTPSGGREYDFTNGGAQHQAYYYDSYIPLKLFKFLFLRMSPLRHTARAETEFDDDFYYPAIKTNDGLYAQSSAQGLHNLAVHHFRFKLTGDAQAIGAVNISWYGKADQATIVRLYYWKYSNIPFVSKWTPLDDESASGDIALQNNISESDLEDALGPNNYLDICVVATKEGAECTLYSDYIKLRSTQQTGYQLGYGLVQTKTPVSIDVNKYWELLTWDDYESGTAKVTYQILYYNGSDYVPLKNSVLNGNEQGFTTPPVSLTSLSNTYLDLKIQANLSTEDAAVSPKVYSWTLTWQKKNQWQDLFHSEYRIEEKKRVTRNDVDDTINISLVSGDWPMFGQNAENTRASPGKAAYVKNLYWWSDIPELRGQTPSNPVIDGDSLYFSTIDSDNKGHLYRYHSTIVSESNIGKNFTGTIQEFKIPDNKPIVGSPVIADQYLVVATGEQDSENYLCRFEKDKPSNPAKTFNLSSKLCYWGSPIIADGRVFLTSWSGNAALAGYHKNNMLLMVELSSFELKDNKSFPVPSGILPQMRSPTWSFSTPAYANGIVVVGCLNTEGDSLFAYTVQNNSLELLWNISVGAIGKAAPVISNNTVYIVSEEVISRVDGLRKRTRLTAVDLEDGSILWQVPLGRTLFDLTFFDSTYCLANATPAVLDTTVYVTSPDGRVYALDALHNGTTLWEKEVYSKVGPSMPILTSSPAYADHILYVGTPAGYVYALNTSANGSELWNRQMYPYDRAIPVATDPIVANGLVFFAGENGRLYVCGLYVTPSEQLSGSLTSLPITLPTGSWWKKFYAQVQTNASASINKITFSILDEDGKFLREITNTSDILQANQTIGRTIQLHADFWAKNSTVNPRLFYWNVTFEPDPFPPFINQSTLTPSTSGYLNEVVPEFTVKVKDNHTGLLVNSARYTLEYILEGQTKHDSYPAVCTGINGTKAVETITVNISTLDFYANITELKRLWINISDLAGNQDTLDVRIKQDRIAPNSSVKPQGLKTRYNATAPYVRINATSFDNGTDASGISRIDLYYRYSSTGKFNGTDWIFFANATKRKNPSWRFNFTDKPTQKGGYFELCTVATDNASNVEDFPTTGDVSFIYDWKTPELPSYAGDTLWFKERPLLSVVFKDDFRLHTIRYRPNFETSWTTIASKVNASTYTTPWLLKEEYWDQMEEDEIYYLYFQINDTVGNLLTATSESTAIIIRKDTFVPSVTIDLPQVEPEWIWEENFTVSAFVNDRDGSGVDSVELYYRFSTDNTNWTDWTLYGDALSASPFDWDFTAAEGDGYYEFKIVVTDKAGNEAESEVLSSAVSSFPTTLVLVMVGLLILLAFISAILFIKWKKHKEQ